MNTAAHQKVSEPLQLVTVFLILPRTPGLPFIPACPPSVNHIHR